MHWSRLGIAVLLIACCLAAAAVAAAGPRSTRTVYAPGKLVPIPASIPHEPGDMVDRRIVPNLRWLAARFPIYVTDGYSGPLPGGGHAGCRGCHVSNSDHHNGLAVDIVPVRWSPRCDRNWRGVTRLARWAEPRQNRPVAPFRWVGYDGDAHHGCGHHLHLSWDHASAPSFRLAPSVEVFRVPRAETKPAAPARPGSVRAKKQRPARPRPPRGVRGGQVTATPPPTLNSGGISHAGANNGGVAPAG
jgi:hypothetical protein